MSWIAGLAGKAEQLLNKVDQTAALTLGKGELTDDEQGDQRSERHHPQQHWAETGGARWTATPRADVAARDDAAADGSSRRPAEPQVWRSAAVSQQPPGAANGRSKPTQHAHSRKVEEDLFRYLNSSPETKRKSHAHSRQSSTASNKTTDSGLYFTARPETPNLAEAASEGVSVTTATSATGAVSESQDEALEATVVLQQHEQPSSPLPGATTESYDVTATASGAQQLSAMRLENDLLRSEISSLNQEISAILKRERRLEQDLATARQQLLGVDERMSNSDQALRELRSRESDAQEALRAKDSQVAVLRVRLEECESDLTASRRRVDELESECGRLLKDHSDSSGVHGQAVDNLKAKMADAETLLAREREAHREAQSEATARLARLESDRQMLAETVTQLQKKTADERARADTSTQRLRSVEQALEASRQELAEYKDKASRILQSKDRLLASMRDGADLAPGGLSVASGVPVAVMAEIEELQSERATLREELHRCRATIESLRMELQDIDVQRHSDAESARAEMQAVESRLTVEQAKAKDAEATLEAKTRDCRVIQEELATVRAALQRQIQERDAEIEKLRSQLVSKRLSTASETELEGRLRALTESLIQKQTLVESLSTERSSLRLQLERLEQQCRAMEAVAQAASSGGGATSGRTGRRGPIDDAAGGAISIDDVDSTAGGLRSRNLPGFMTESPTDTPVIRRLKRSANTLDKFSVHLGLFLRRYPIARIFVIAYMMLLHLWVVVVLTTYQPEVHGASVHP